MTEIIIGLTLFTASVAGFLIWQAAKASKSGSQQQMPDGHTEEFETNVPIYKLMKFKMAMGLIVLYIIAVIIVANSYRPYNPKKDGVPKEQTDTTRQAAEDF